MPRKLGSGGAPRANFVPSVEPPWTACRATVRDGDGRCGGPQPNSPGQRSPAAGAWDALRMIARIWRGATAADRAQDYLEYLRKTGIADYRATPGNHGVEVLMRTQGDRTDFTLITYWDSLDAVKAFAGDPPETARFYPEDDDYLIDRELTAEHHEVARIARG